MRTFTLPLLAATLLVPAAAQAQSTTRIETRPFYGATVTLEEGVRVFRPLPSHDRVIINPGGATPLNLTFEERRSVSHTTNSGGSHEQTAESGGGYSIEGSGNGQRRGTHQPRTLGRSVTGAPAQGHGSHR